MPLKTPWPDPFSGLATGLESGMKMGLMARQQKLAEQESLAKAAAEKEKVEAEADKEKLVYFTKIQADPNTSDADSIAAHNALIPIIKKRYGVEWTPTDTWAPEYTKAAKQALNIWNSEDYSPADKLKLINGVYTATTEAAQKRLKPMLEEAEQGAQQAALGGASDISTRMRMNPELWAQADPSVLEGIESERMRLLTQGGTAGLAQWQKGMEGVAGGKKETGLVSIIGEDKKPHALLYEKESGNIIKDMGIVKSETESGRDYVTVVTDKGIFSVNKKTNTASPVHTEEGEKIYGKTPSEIKTAVKNLDDNIAAVQGVKEIYDAGIPGAISGRVHKYGSKFFSDKEYTQLKNRVGQLRTLVYGLSGKQINETELQWLKEEILPSLMQPSDNFEMTLAEYDAWVKRNRRLFETQYPDLGSQRPAGAKDTKKPTPSGGWGIERVD